MYTVEEDEWERTITVSGDVPGEIPITFQFRFNMLNPKRDKHNAAWNEAMRVGAQAMADYLNGAK